MSRGFFKHIWYKLLDEEGVPLSAATVYIYDDSDRVAPFTELILFDANEDVLPQPISTDVNGVFEFYVKDHIRSSIQGYDWSTQYIISWSKDDKGGLIYDDLIWGNFASLSVTGSGETLGVSGSDGTLNKAISNFIGWTINDHVDFQFGTTQRCGSSSSSSSSQSSSSQSSSSQSSSSLSSLSSTSVEPACSLTCEIGCDQTWFQTISTSGTFTDSTSGWQSNTSGEVALENGLGWDTYTPDTFEICLLGTSSNVNVWLRDGNLNTVNFTNVSAGSILDISSLDSQIDQLRITSIDNQQFFVTFYFDPEPSEGV